jgi:sirohydrochlorin ferrochelatase
MDDRDHTDRDEANEDHWEAFAVAMELTIEGHRLIAEEIGFELKLLWRGVVSWLRDLIGTLPRGRSVPPV